MKLMLSLGSNPDKLVGIFILFLAELGLQYLWFNSKPKK